MASTKPARHVQYRLLDVNSHPVLHFNDFCDPRFAGHHARTRYAAGGSIGLHGHDFAEIFWIESGRGVQMTPTGRSPLEAGSIRLIRPGDVHGIRALSTTHLVLANVAFDSRALGLLSGIEEAGRRIVERLANDGCVTSATCVELLGESFARLANSPRRRLELHRFLLDVLCTVDADLAGARSASQLPGWLATALEAVRQESSLLARGASALAQLAGKSADHLNRVCRRHLGVTASAVVNRLRLERAEYLLQSTPMEITDVAFESGFNNLSYFYRLFRERVGTTPRVYRDMRVQPVLPGSNREH